MNTHRPEEVTRRFVFRNGRAVVVEEKHAVEQDALANLRAEAFDDAAMDEERSLSFDLDRDGKLDVLAGALASPWVGSGSTCVSQMGASSPTTASTHADASGCSLPGRGVITI